MVAKVYAPLFELLIIPAYFSDEKEVEVLPAIATKVQAKLAYDSFNKQLKKMADALPDLRVAYKQTDTAWVYWLAPSPPNTLQLLLSKDTQDESPPVRDYMGSPENPRENPAEAA